DHEMVGLLPIEVVMTLDRLTLGYRQLEVILPCPIGDTGITARGHEFHYSSMNTTAPTTFVGRIVDAQGRSVGYDGLLCNNAVAFYTHLHFGSQLEIARSLLQQARAFAERRAASVDS
ncbi:MAG: cobyrinic acid a,c-diamide synthase, partial [Nitrospirae bacterium]